MKVLALVVAAIAAAAIVVGAAAARGTDAECAPPGGDATFSLAVRSLTGPAGGDVALAVTPTRAGCAVPDTLKKVQLKLYAPDGTLTRSRNVKDVSAPGGTANLALGSVERGQRITADVLVQSPDGVRTYVLTGETTAKLRPDLVVSALHAPAQVLAGRAFAVDATVAERNGDVGATATVTLTAGDTVVATKPVEIAAGSTTSVSFGASIAQPGTVDYRVAVADAAPAETDVTNNDAHAKVEATEYQLDPLQVLVASLAGFGGQLNQHVYAAISSPPVTPTNVLEMETKLLALQPQFVRIFFNTTEFTVPDRMASFVRTVGLAQRAGATINVTWQGGGTDRVEFNMNRFANVLIDLVRNHGATNLRWVTIQNAPNTTKITTTLYEQMYRSLDGYLRAGGVRDQVRFMGGDLTADNQQVWFDYMAQHMSDLLDAWSIHVAWNYWDTPKIGQRLTDVRAIWDAEPADQRKPLYVSEYDVRGNKNCTGIVLDPGGYDDCSPLAKTNINAFQHGLFTLRATQLGFVGQSKWDSYYGRYDNSPQAYYMIGSPLEGWPLNPVYYVTRLLTATVRAGSSAVGFDAADASSPKLVVSYAGQGGELTIVGIDSDGATTNTPSTTSIPYSLGGLPPNTTFHLWLWNGDGAGRITSGGDMTSDAAGVLEVGAPLTSMFALTTLSTQP